MCGCCPTFLALSLGACSSIYLLCSASWENPSRALAGLCPQPRASLAAPLRPATHLTLSFPLQMRTVALRGTQRWRGLLSPASPGRQRPIAGLGGLPAHLPPLVRCRDRISRGRGWESKSGLRPACAWSQALFCQPTSLLAASRSPSCASRIHAHGMMLFNTS